MQEGVIVKIQNKGLITIPKAYREELGLEKGGLARIRRKSGGLVIEPVRVLPYPIRSYTRKELEEFLKLDEKETKKLKKKSLL
jgi:AbrB family looped-hinge helix DNA binding protein